MARSGGMVRRPPRLRRHATTERKPARALEGVAREGASELVLVLTAAGVRLVRAAGVADALDALHEQAAQVVIADAGPARA